jgi:glycerophosphoryl diester phosphodiesterase
MSRGQISKSVPLIIGHRGASAHAPENTLASFDLAFIWEADGIEFDVRLARDGVPVVIHDASFVRTAYLERRVEEFDSTVIEKFYAGEWFNLRNPSRAFEDFAFERIPTLAQVFERYGEHHLYVEMKCEEPSRRADLARAVVRLMREHGLGERVVVKSFEHDSLVEVKRLAPDVRTAALFGRSWPRPLLPAARILADAAACGADEISLHRSLLRRGTVQAAHRSGFAVVAWTVNSSVLLRRAVSLGLRAVITDYPRNLKAVLMRKPFARAGASRSIL